MQWVVENGEFKIIDAQQSGRNGYETFLHADTAKGISVYRLDNAEVLPGVTDFVEPYEMTWEELLAQEEFNKKKTAKAKEATKAKAEKLKVADDRTTKLRDKQLWDDKSLLDKVKYVAKNGGKQIAGAVNEVKNNAKKTVSNLTKKAAYTGRKFIDKLFNR